MLASLQSWLPASAWTRTPTARCAYQPDAAEHRCLLMPMCAGRSFFSMPKAASSSLITGISLTPDGAVVSNFQGIVRFVQFL